MKEKNATLNEQQKKNNRTVLIIFAMSIIPFCFAWYLSSNAAWMGGGTNNGELIMPPVTTEFNEFLGYDEFSTANLQEIKGHWILVNVIPRNDCNEICKEAIHKTKQLRLMMNKDLTRVRRLVLVNTEIKATESQPWWAEDKRLLRIKLSTSILEKINKTRVSGIDDGMLFFNGSLGEYYDAV